jgi:hypothetical protein
LTLDAPWLSIATTGIMFRLVCFLEPRRRAVFKAQITPAGDPVAARSLPVRPQQGAAAPLPAARLAARPAGVDGQPALQQGPGPPGVLLPRAARPHEPGVAGRPGAGGPPLPPAAAGGAQLEARSGCVNELVGNGWSADFGNMLRPIGGGAAVAGRRRRPQRVRYSWQKCQLLLSLPLLLPLLVQRQPSISGSNVLHHTARAAPPAREERLSCGGPVLRRPWAVQAVSSSLHLMQHKPKQKLSTQSDQLAICHM